MMIFDALNLSVNKIGEIMFKRIMTGLLSVSFFMLAGCGSNGGTAGERPTAGVKGFAVDAQITGGDVTVYSFKNGEKGEVLGTGTTDEQGFYQIDISAPDQAILIEVKNGSYIEEATETSVSLRGGQVLRALTFFKSGVPVDTMVTPFTSLAAGLSEYHIKSGVPIENALTQGATAITAMLGIDILTTVPLNITDVENQTTTLTPELIYGFWTAGISAWTAEAGEKNGTEPHEVWTSIAFAQIMYRDIKDDGFLDGKGVDPESEAVVDLGFGLVSLDANTYRTELAQKMMFMVGSDQNQTGIRLDQALSRAEHLAATTHEMFGGLAPVPLDDEGPVITPFEAEGQYENATFDFKVIVSDAVGMKSVIIDIDGAEIGQVADPSNPSFPINTELYEDGEYQVGVRAIDNLDNETYETFRINFANSGSQVNLLSPTWVNESPTLMSGNYIDNGTGAQLITVDGIPADIDTENQTWSVEVPLVPLEGGSAAFVRPVTLEITDTLGVKNTESIIMTMDTLAPKFEPVPQYSLATFIIDGDTFRDELSVANDSGVAVRIETDDVSLGSTPILEGPLDNNDIPWIRLRGEDININGVFTPDNEITAEIQYSLDGTVLTPWRTLEAIVCGVCTSDNYRFIIPLASEVLHQDWHLAAPDEEHLIEVKIKDKAGNTADYIFRFKAEFIPPAPLIVSKALRSFDVPFEERNSLFGSSIPLVEYTITNPSPHAVLFSLDSTSAHTVSKTHEWAIRRHRATLFQTEEWRIQPRFTRTEGSSEVVCQPTRGLGFDLCYRVDTPPVTVENPNATWQMTNEVYIWTQNSIPTYSTSLVQLKPSAPKVRIAETELSSKSFPAVPVSYTDTLWRTIFPWPSAENGGPGEWFAKPYNYFLRLGPRDDNTGRRNMDGVPFAMDNGSERRNYFQGRTVYRWVSTYGPTNEYGSETQDENFSTEAFVVRDKLSVEKLNLNGWYRLPAGESFTITSLTNTPALTFHNDTVLGRPYKPDYTLRQYDESLLWTVRENIDLKIVHDVGLEKAPDMVAHLHRENGDHTVNQSRP